jgi:hypothetical protein
LPEYSDTRKAYVAGSKRRAVIAQALQAAIERLDALSRDRRAAAGAL